MAVIQISKIQVRRGLEENLPQLASGEFGWSIDSQRLWIGNGTLTEGAPQPGNTEIITAGRDLLSAIKSYSFKGVFANAPSGYAAQTGASALSPIKRSFQDKLDDVINVKDFGAIGDGVANDTDAINRALDHVYDITYFNNNAIRRTLHIPAGTYVMTESLYLPPYVTIIGDGIDSTIIKQTGSFNGIRFSDSLGQRLASYGALGASLPKYVTISGLTMKVDTDNDGMFIDSVTDVLIDNVKFAGNYDNPVAINESVAGIRVEDTVAKTSRVTIKDCVFSDLTYGVYASGRVEQLAIENSNFYNLYQGLVLADLGGNVPVAVRVKSNIFDLIANSGIYVTDGANFVGAFNYFKDVANGLAGAGNPAAPVIYYKGTNNYVFASMFDRNDFDDSVYPRIHVANVAQTSVTVNSSGTLEYGSGAVVTLADNTINGNTGITFSNGITSAIIDYTINRDSIHRVGTIKYSQDGSGNAEYDDEYSESTSTGVTLEFAYDGVGNVNMTYSTSSTGYTAALNYQIRRFTSV